MGKVIKLDCFRKKMVDARVVVRHMTAAEAVGMLMPTFITLSKDLAKLEEMLCVMIRATPDAEVFQVRRAEKSIRNLAVVQGKALLHSVPVMEHIVATTGPYLNENRAELAGKTMNLIAVALTEAGYMVTRFQDREGKAGGVADVCNALLIASAVIEQLRQMYAWFIEVQFGAEDSDSFHYAEQVITRAWQTASTMYQR